MLLEMIASAFGDRLGVGHRRRSGLTYQQLLDRAGAGRRGAAGATGARHVAYVGTSDDGLPRRAVRRAPGPGCRFLPLNYRLGDEQLAAAARPRTTTCSSIADDRRPSGCRGAGGHGAVDRRVERGRPSRAGRARRRATTDGEDVAVLLYTSGTTAAPKAVVLRHRHLSVVRRRLGRVRRRPTRPTPRS